MRYEIYKKTTDGKRGTIIENFTKFDAALRFNEVGKWQISGASNEGCPFAENDGIIVYREGKPFISGYVTDIAEEVDESYTGGQVINWSVEGLDDNGLLGRRVIIPDPVNLDLTAAAHQTIRDYGGNAILDYIHTQAGTGAKTGREVPNLTVDSDKNLGTIQTYQARFQNLWEFCVKISEGQALGVRVIWDGEQGRYTATVYAPTDKSDLIIFSREFGNLKKWSRKRSAPTANAIWVAGQGEKVDRMFAYREDAASIAKWGRFEAVKDRRDLSNEQDAADPRTPQQILDDTAEELIEANKATEGYELELAPIERMSYRDDWELGDIVKVRVGTTEFKAIIEEVKINYAGGIETVTPSVGTINRGTIAKTYSTIQAIGERVAVLERNEGQGHGLLDLFNAHVHNGTDAPKVSAKNIIGLYPVGSIYMSISPTDPSQLFGGTWVRWGHGRVPIGVWENDSRFNTPEKAGGEFAHTMTSAEMPGHRHWVSSASRDDGNGTGCGDNTQDYGLWADAGAYNVNDTAKNTGRFTAWQGSGTAFNIVQPYITCYMWRRVS